MSVSALSLGELLESEAREATAFVELLKQEQALLVDGNVDGLLPLVERKSAFTTKLTELADARERVVNQSGAGSGRAGMETYLSRQPANQALRNHWEALLAAAAEAQALNQSNGQLIRLHLKHNLQAMNVLMLAADRATTYGPDGHQRTAGSGRFLGSA